MCSLPIFLGSCNKNLGILKKFINASGPPQAAAGQYTAARRLRRRTGPAGGGPGFREGRPPGGGLGSQRWLVQCTPHFLFFCGTEKEKTGRARSKREKDAGRGTAWAEDRQDFCPRTGVHGGWAVEERSVLLAPLARCCGGNLFALCLPGEVLSAENCKKKRLPILSSADAFVVSNVKSAATGQEVKSFPRPPKPPPAPIAWATPAGLPPKSPPRPRKPRRLFIFLFENKN